MDSGPRDLRHPDLIRRPLGHHTSYTSKTVCEHSSTRRKSWEVMRLNRGAQLSTNCITTPLSYQGPTIPMGPPYANHPHATWRPSQASAGGPSAWPPATRQRHLRLARATQALPRGLSAASHHRGGPASHVSACSCRSPRQHLQVRTLFFCDFK